MDRKLAGVRLDLEPNDTVHPVVRKRRKTGVYSTFLGHQLPASSDQDPLGTLSMS